LSFSPTANKKNIAKRVGFEVLNDPSPLNTQCTPLEKEKSAVGRADLIAPPVQQPTATADSSAPTEKQAGADLYLLFCTCFWEHQNFPYFTYMF
jgi:hypothetical protein